MVFRRLPLTAVFLALLDVLRNEHTMDVSSVYAEVQKDAQQLPAASAVLLAKSAM